MSSGIAHNTAMSSPLRSEDCNSPKIERPVSIDERNDRSHRQNNKLNTQTDKYVCDDIRKANTSVFIAQKPQIIFAIHSCSSRSVMFCFDCLLYSSRIDRLLTDRS